MRKLFFPKKIIQKMREIGVSESQINDVFYNGEDIKGKNGRHRKYNGYEIGYFYVRDFKTEEYRLTAVWKRERR